jgi:hypothetical protein
VNSVETEELFFAGAVWAGLGFRWGAVGGSRGGDPPYGALGNAAAEAGTLREVVAIVASWLFWRQRLIA